MIVEKRYVNENQSDAYFTAYLLENSKDFLRDKKRPVVIIAPGGGYLTTSDREADPIAMCFLAKGYHAVVLRYSVGDLDGTRTGVGKQALKEIAFTVKALRKRADKWFIDPDKIVLCGFSAGGHLAASLGVRWHETELAESVEATPEQIKPNAVILGYPLLNYKVMLEKMQELHDGRAIENFAYMRIANRALTGQEEMTEELVQEYSPACKVDCNTVPMFLWHTAQDQVVYVENSLTFAIELSKYNIPYELHIFQHGQHGLALANEVTANNPDEVNEECQLWIDLALNWVARNIKL